MHILKVPDMYIKITAAAIAAVGIVVVAVMVVVLVQVTARMKT
jgi:hypothetical protein